MKGRAIIPLVVGLAVGVVAIKLFADVLKKAQAARSVDAVKVVCAKADIAPTIEIQESMVEVKSVPKTLVPQGAVLDPAKVAGRVTRLTVPAGMPVLPNLLAPAGTPPGMAVRIKDGYRAVAVKIDESAGVAGWIIPGCHVDVVAVMTTTGVSGHRETISRVILEKAEVLAVGQDIGASGDASAALAKSVTLLVRPKDVPKLHLAATNGKVRLAMRNQKDFGVSEDAQTTDKELLTGTSGTKSTEQASNPSKKSSFLSRLMVKQPKKTLAETDKDSGSNQAAEAVPAPTGVSSWRVEVLTGSKTEEVWFDGKTGEARRLESNTHEDRNKRQPIAMRHMMPAREPQSILAAEEAVPSRSPQSSIITE